MKATSPEVTGEIHVNLRGEADLTPAQLQELAGRRIGSRTNPPEGYEWAVIVYIWSGKRREMLTTVRHSTLDDRDRLVGWHEWELRKNGLPDGRATATRIGVVRSTKMDQVPRSEHYSNHRAIYDCQREACADAARMTIARAEEELERAKVVLLNLYLEKP